jgi:hypothetical protein
LLQNAEDSVETGETVSVKVSLKGDKLVFSHTGNPFGLEDIAHLIFHGSSKRFMKDKTGRFGTGFMTTHLLSKKVRIKGVLVPNNEGEIKCFDFVLDRDASDDVDQKEKLAASYNNFKEYNNPHFSDGDYKSSFEYDLVGQGKITAEKGIRKLKQILSVVIAFNTKIKEIEVIHDDNIFRIEKSEPKPFGDYLLHHIEINDNGESGEEVVLTTKGETENSYVFGKDKIKRKCHLNTAIILEKKGDSYSVKPLTETYPRLFLNFPLFGSEKLGCPIIINSPDFKPNKERDGIPLEEDKENNNILKNREIIKTALASISSLMETLSNKNIKVLKSLFRFNEPPDINWLDNQWIENNYQSIISHLLKSPYWKIDETENRYSINELKFPIGNKKAFYEVVKSYYGDLVFDFEEVKSWINIFEEIKSLQNKNKIEFFSFVLTHQVLCNTISTAKTIEGLQSKIEDKEIDVYDWLNNFYGVLDDNFKLYSGQYKIIPNQEHTLCLRESGTIFFDENVNEKLKNIAHAMTYEVKKKLIHKKIKRRNEIATIKTIKILERLEELSHKDSLFDIEEFKKGLVSLFQWKLDHRNDDNLTNLNIEKTIIITNDNKKRTLVMESNKLLPPSKFWIDKYPTYKKLVNHKFLLSDRYAPLEEDVLENTENEPKNQNVSLSQDDIDYLIEQDFIYSSPLIIEKHLPENSNELGYLFDDEDIDKIKEFENPADLSYSNIPYLKTSDDNILAKTARGGKSSINLLYFILHEVLKEDKTFDKTDLYGNIEYSKSLWVNRLKETRWVNSKVEDEEVAEDGKQKIKNKATEVSTASISPLLKKAPQLLKDIDGELAARFFMMLEISISDIIRNNLTDKNDRIQWDLTFSSLLTHEKLKQDPKMLKEILIDKKFINDYEKLKARRKNIRKNYEVGTEFEKTFKIIFENDEFDNFSIDRKTKGQDFDLLVEYDFSTGTEDENEEKIINFINTPNTNEKYLLELKTAYSDFTQMSIRQAEYAVEHQQKYILIVLPLKKEDEITKTFIETKARFITDIASLLEEKHNIHQSFLSLKEEAKDGELVALNITGSEIKFQINKPIWERKDNNTKTFTEFTEWLKNQG